MKIYRKKSAGKRNVFFRTVIVGLLLLLLLLLLSYLKLGVLLSSGRENPVHIKHVLVLAGQGALMVRSDQALKLLNTEKVEQIVLSSPQLSRGYFIAEPICEDYKNQGLDKAESVLMLEHFATSTYQEAKDLIPYFVKLNVDTVLLVTNAFHASRAKYIFNSLSQGQPYFLVSEFDDPEYLASDWSRSRKTVKMSVLESIKWALTLWEINVSGNKEWGGVRATPCVLKEKPEIEKLQVVEVEAKVDSIDVANLKKGLKLNND